MKVGILWSVILFVLIAGCSGDEGPDSLSSHTTSGAGSLTECNDCHLVATLTRRQIVGSQGDFGANTGNLSHHIAGPSDPTTAQCEVCHDQSTHTSGIVRLRDADGGPGVLYNPLDPTTLEPFCLSCHDDLGATSTFIGATALDPFGDSRTLGTIPNVAGNKIDGYWNNSYTIHKDNGLTCAGTGEQATGCHGSNGKINMHGSASKGLLTSNMTLPIPSGSPYDENDFKLCFDCHDNYDAVTKEVILGYQIGGNYDVWWAPTPYDTPIQSLFRDRYISGDPRSYSDTIWGDPYTPLHNYHMTPTDAVMQSIWNYRGNDVGRASCTTCHNVHGTAGTVRSTYRNFGITAYTAGPDSYKTLEPIGNYEDLVFKAYPINCSISCHGIVPGTSYWHTPSDE